MPLPTFLVIGAPKCGTTSLYHYLSQHPRICMSEEKEPYFFCYTNDELAFGGPGAQGFADSIISDLDRYRALFDMAGRHEAIGEATPFYLYCPKAARRIKGLIPDVRLVAVLKNPVDRAFSHYLHFRLRYVEPLESFAAALDAEARRIEENWGPGYHYKQVGFYGAQLRRYFALFDRDQIKVLLQTDLSRSPMSVVQDCFDFLGVERGVSLSTSMRYNVTGLPRNPALHAILTKPSRLKQLLATLLPSRVRRQAKERVRGWNLAKPEVPREVRSRLTAEYREDILELQDLIGRDLSGWLVA
jgi:hypothetical protein